MVRNILRFDFAAMTLVAIGTLTVSLPKSAHADGVTPPPMPADIQVDAPNLAFLEGHAVGTQNYICLPSGSGFAWTLFTPQATLSDDDDKQIITHFNSPNPDPSEPGTIRATWQHSRDTSTIWAKAVKASTDANFVAKDAIPWVKLQVVGFQDGPTGGDKLSPTTFVQRLNTAGGVAPSSGCSELANVGAKAFVPYKADYLFYK